MCITSLGLDCKVSCFTSKGLQTWGVGTFDCLKLNPVCLVCVTFNPRFPWCPLWGEHWWLHCHIVQSPGNMYRWHQQLYLWLRWQLCRHPVSFVICSRCCLVLCKPFEMCCVTQSPVLYNRLMLPQKRLGVKYQLTYLLTYLLTSSENVAHISWEYTDRLFGLSGQAETSVRMSLCVCVWCVCVWVCLCVMCVYM